MVLFSWNLAKSNGYFQIFDSVSLNLMQEQFSNFWLVTILIICTDNRNDFNNKRNKLKFYLQRQILDPLF